MVDDSGQRPNCVGGQQCEHEVTDHGWVANFDVELDTRRVLTLGRHLWRIYNDLDCTGEEAVLPLSLTTCTDDQVNFDLYFYFMFYIDDM